MSIAPGGVRCVWQRHELETKTNRLKALEAKVAQDSLILTEAQVMALEATKTKKEAHGEFESEHLGLSWRLRPTFYGGTLKGVGRLYQLALVEIPTPRWPWPRPTTARPRSRLLAY